MRKETVLCEVTMHDNDKIILLDVNRILGMGKVQYDLTRCKSARPDGVFTGNYCLLGVAFV